MSEIIGKNKKVINYESYASVPRNASDSTELAENIKRSVYAATIPVVPQEKDVLKIVIGKNWDNDVNQETGVSYFDNEWPRPKIFLGTPLHLEMCSDPVQVPGKGPFSLEQVYEQTLVLSNKDLANWAIAQGGAPGLEAKMAVMGSGEMLRRRIANLWAFIVKAGVINQQGELAPPIVNSKRVFQDHYHETPVPFTNKELEGPQPAGKTFFANFKTYYNERLKSKRFETISGNQNDELTGPSLYGFLKLFANPLLSANNFFNLGALLNQITVSLPTNASSKQYEKSAAQIMMRYPLEALNLYYGKIEGQIVEQLVLGNDKTTDIDALYEEYYDLCADTLLSTNMVYNPETQTAAVADAKLKRALRVAERMQRNILFSPNFVPFMGKVDKYKKYFPYYSEIQFTAKLQTSLGDAMKDSFMTKAMAYHIASSFNVSDNTSGPWEIVDKNWNIKDNMAASGVPVSQVWSKSNFVELPEFSATKYGPDGQFVIQAGCPTCASGPQVYGYDTSQEIAGQTPFGLDGTNEKNIIDLPPIFDKYISSGISYPFSIDQPLVAGEGGSSQQYLKDIRNYLSYVKDDFSDPNILAEENPIFKTLFGTYFYTRIAKIYDEKKRSYEEILDGKPAYTEDLFYRIEKRYVDANGNEWPIQNFLIPNTSDLDIVKLVDTQLKYSTYAKYKYYIYAERIVFGTKYYYRWLDPETHDTIEYDPGAGGDDASQFPPVVVTDNPQTLNGHPERNLQALRNSLTFGSPSGLSYPVEEAWSQGDMILDSGEVNPEYIEWLSAQAPTEEAIWLDYTATFKVITEPSIVLMEDKLFETPIVSIMDRPPVSPSVNVVPYRSVNNKVKIMLDSRVDRYRMEPIYILNSDEAHYKELSDSQLAQDGKIEFGSDDFVNKYQIFRTTQRPKTYRDFQLHTTIESRSLDDVIKPNTKYYYTFRAIDQHDNISNPTPIYEVELVDEKGAVKPLIRTIALPTSEEKYVYEDLQKYIYLKPSAEQLYLSGPESSIDSIFSDSSSKKKKFKMRLTSKSSGKKIDINFSFQKLLE